MRTGETGGKRGEAFETRRIDLDPSRDFHARSRALKHQRTHFRLLNERIDLAFKPNAQVVSGKL
jgi:hypothetical protein